MKRTLLSVAFLFFITSFFISGTAQLSAQVYYQGTLLEGFDEEAVLGEYRTYMGSDAEKKYPDEYKGFLELRKNQYIDKKLGKVYSAPSYTIEEPHPDPFYEGCGNIDFEDGNFNEWEGRYGFRRSHAPYLNQVGIATSGINWPKADGTTHHTITAGPGIDSCGPVPIVAPNFPGQVKNRYSVRLGNRSPGWGSEQLTYTFTPDSVRSIFYYQYAVIFQNPSDHDSLTQPMFEAVFFDENGDTIPCTYYMVQGASDTSLLDNYYCAGGFGNSVVKYNPWKLKSIDLSSYMGQSITGRFTTEDCGHGAHYGYAYFDAYCGPPEMGFEAEVSCAGQPVELEAPDGTAWDWSTGESTQTIFVTDTGTYSVTVTGDAIDNCQQYIEYHVTSTPGPIAAFNFNAGDCAFDVPFTDSSYIEGGAGTIVSWDWTFGDGATSTEQNPTHTYPGMGDYVITLIVTSDNGCTDTISDSLSITQKPIADLSSGPVCLNNTTNFTDLSTMPPPATNADITGWLWNFGEPSSADSNTSTLQNPTHRYQSAGTYDVTLITYAGSCVDTANIQVTVNPLPQAAFSADNPCIGNPTNFSDESTIAAPGTITTWSWNFGDGATSTDQNPTHTYAAEGDYDVILTVTSDSGCQSTVSIPVSVNEAPIAAMSGHDVCLGAINIFTNTSTGAITSYLWDFGDGNTSTDASPTHMYTDSGTYVVHLTVAIGFCTDTMSTVVQVMPYPTADFSISPNPASAMDPVITFTDHSIGGDSGTWNFGDGTDTIYNPSVGSVTHIYPVENANQEYGVTLSIVNAAGCPAFVRKSFKMDPFWSFYIPDAFSPNGDDKNQTFFGKGVGIVEYEMWIFDRWGNRVFHCDIDNLPQDPMCHWDGSKQLGGSGDPAQQDVYVWVVELKNVFDKRHRYIGHVTLIK